MSKSTVKDEIKEAGQHLKEAGTVAEKSIIDFLQETEERLDQKWSEAKDASHEKKKELAEDYRRYLTEMEVRMDLYKDEVQHFSKEQRRALEKKIKETRQHLHELEDSTTDNWDAVKGAFQVGWQELRDAFRKAKSEFEARHKAGSTKGQ